MSESLESLLRYWGKFRRDADSWSWHPLILHCFDVAAVAAALMDTRADWLARAARTLRLRPESARALLLWLVVLHDLGKFAGNFQVRVAELLPVVKLSRQRFGSAARHDVVGLAMSDELLAALHEVVQPTAQIFEPMMLPQLFGATTGHHGAPRCANGIDPYECWNAEQMDAAIVFARLSWDFLGVEIVSSVHEPATEEEINDFTWELAGLTILADWLGSNVDWFPYAAADSAMSVRCKPKSVDELGTYWSDAQKRARTALIEAGLLPAGASTFDRGHVVDAARELRPAQHVAAETLELPDGPSLLLIEDQTGAGKTEAALLWFHRLFAAGLVDGFYIGLPTQATANALYRRVLDILPQLLLDGMAASVVLAHAARDRNASFRSTLAVLRQLEALIPGEHAPASVGCSAWLAASSKRALLAQFGVGTIDQSVLAVLRSKHQALRLFGLDRKLLLVDEVHAYDAYQAHLLQTLVTRTAARGGHVVLLSATLPATQRRQYAAAFARGAKRRRRNPVGESDAGAACSQAYPLLTLIGDAGMREYAVPVQRPLAYRIRYVTQIESVIDAIVAAAEAGKAVAWIRNTVSEAIAAHGELMRRLPEPLRERLRLFHSRFTFGDRDRIEREVLDNYGKLSTVRERRGRVLVATQVIEQSLDIDADVLVTDLAPIDLLVQRAGRLRRHARDVDGNPLTDGVDQRGELELIVFGPDRDAEVEANWVSSWSRGTAVVYEDHRQLWLTAHVIGDYLDLRESPRAPIEAVYGDDAEPGPAALQRSSFNAEGKQSGDRTLAGYNVIGDNERYENNGVDWPDDLTAPTRLADPTIELVLALLNGTTLRPWNAADGDDAWDMSLLRVRTSMVAADEAGTGEPAPYAETLQHPALRWRRVLVLEQEGEMFVARTTVDAAAKVATLKRCLIYDAQKGLRSG